MTEWESILLDADEAAGTYTFLLLATRDGATLAKRQITWRKFEHPDDYIITGVNMALSYMVGQVGE